MTDDERKVIIETQLHNLASILDGKWQFLTVLHSNGDSEDQILITFNHYSAKS